MGSRKVHRREAQIPDHPELSLVIYGQDTANTTWSKMEQGYVVRLNGCPTPRSELAQSSLQSRERQCWHTSLSTTQNTPQSRLSPTNSRPARANAKAGFAIGKRKYLLGM